MSDEARAWESAAKAWETSASAWETTAVRALAEAEKVKRAYGMRFGGGWEPGAPVIGEPPPLNRFVTPEDLRAKYGDKLSIGPEDDHWLMMGRQFRLVAMREAE